MSQLYHGYLNLSTHYKLDHCELGLHSMLFISTLIAISGNIKFINIYEYVTFRFIKFAMQ